MWVVRRGSSPGRTSAEIGEATGSKPRDQPLQLDPAEDEYDRCGDHKDDRDAEHDGQQALLLRVVHRRPPWTAGSANRTTRALTIPISRLRARPRVLKSH